MGKYLDEVIPYVDIPEKEVGDWAIRKFTIDQEAAKRDRLSCLFSGEYGRSVDPGDYTKLAHRRRGVIMSDTPAEKNDHYMFVRRASGKVMINGLGLGMVTNALLQKSDVTRVVVVEMEAEVISLVAPHFQDPRVEIIEADCFEVMPKDLSVTTTDRFDYVWHDIWDTISADNWPEMNKLHRKWGRFSHYQDSWCRNRVLRLHQEEKQYEQMAQWRRMAFG